MILSWPGSWTEWVKNTVYLYAFVLSMKVTFETSKDCWMVFKTTGLVWKRPSCFSGYWTLIKIFVLCIILITWKHCRCHFYSSEKTHNWHWTFSNKWLTFFLYRFFAELPDGPGKLTLQGKRAEDPVTSGILIDNFGINSCNFYSKYVQRLQYANYYCLFLWNGWLLSFDKMEKLFCLSLQSPTAWETRKGNHSMGLLPRQNQDIAVFHKIK